MKTPEKIRERFGRVTGFLPTRHNAMFVKDGFPTDSDESGYYSDDTVLTFATLRAMTKDGFVDQRNVVRAQVAAANEWPYGFGRATSEVFEKIRKGAPLLESGIDTAGNGVLMKQSPFAAYEVLTGTGFGAMERHVADFTRVTHKSPEAVVASLVHHKVLVDLLLTGSFDAHSVLTNAWSYAKRFENGYAAKGLKDWVTDRIERLLDMTDVSSGRVVSSDSVIRSAFDWGDKMGASCYALTTLGISYALFIRNPHSIDAMFDAVNFGGDTDSYAGIVGSMLGAANGKFFSDELFDGVVEGEALKRETAVFVKKFRK